MENPLFKWSVRCLLINFYSSFFLLAGMSHAQGAYNYMVAYSGPAGFSQDSNSTIISFSKDAFTLASDGTSGTSFYFAAVATNCRYAVYNFSTRGVQPYSLKLLNYAIDMSPNAAGVSSSYFDFNVKSCTPGNIISFNDTAVTSTQYYLAARSDTGGINHQGYIAAISSSGSLSYPALQPQTAMAKNIMAVVPGTGLIVIAASSTIQVYAWTGSDSTLTSSTFSGIKTSAGISGANFILLDCASSTNCAAINVNIPSLVVLFDPTAASLNLTQYPSPIGVNIPIALIANPNVGYLLITNGNLHFFSLASLSYTNVVFQLAGASKIIAGSYSPDTNLIALAINSSAPFQANISILTFDTSTGATSMITSFIQPNWQVQTLQLMRSSQLLVVSYLDLVSLVAKVAVFVNSTCQSSLGSCLICQNASVCTFCSPAQVLDPSVGACAYDSSKASCPVNYFYSQAVGLCRTCSTTSGSYTYYNSSIGGPLGVDNACGACSNTCTCAGSSSNCLLCPASTYAFVLNGTCLTANQCLAAGAAINGSYCDYQCSPSCATCLMSSSILCQTCLSGQYWYPNNFTCSASCDTASGFFVKGTACMMCNLSLCAACQGSANSCLTCSLPAQMNANGVCVNTSCSQVGCNSCSGPTCYACAGNYSLAGGVCSPISNPGGSPSNSSNPLELLSVRYSDSLRCFVLMFSSEIRFSTNFRTSDIRLMLYSPSLYTSSQLNAVFLSNKYNTVDSALQAPNEYPSIVGIKIQGSVLYIDVAFRNQSASNASVGINFNHPIPIVAESDPNQNYTNYFAIVPGVSFFQTQFDLAVFTAKVVAKIVLGTSTSLMLVLSGAQAFSVLKILQSLDFYMFVNVDLPSNVITFLKISTQNIVTVVPNLFSYLAVTDANEERDQFNNYGVSVNIFNNIGQFMTLFFGCIVLRSVISLSAWLARIARNGRTSILDTLLLAFGLEYFYGLIESNNQDILLSLLISYFECHRLKHGSSSYRAIISVTVLLTICMSITYVFMLVKITLLRRTLVEESQLEEAGRNRWMFLLSDKKSKDGISGLFASYYCFLMIMRDVVLSALIYLMYYRPILLVAILLVIQAALTVAVFKYPPFTETYKNTDHKTTHTIYCMILVSLLVIGVLPQGEYLQEKYYYLGFFMIGIISLLLLVSFYHAGKVAYLRLKDALGAPQNEKLNSVMNLRSKSLSKQPFSQLANPMKSLPPKRIVHLTSETNHLENSNSPKYKSAASLNKPESRNVSRTGMYGNFKLSTLGNRFSTRNNTLLHKHKSLFSLDANGSNPKFPDKKFNPSESERELNSPGPS